MYCHSKRLRKKKTHLAERIAIYIKDMNRWQRRNFEFVHHQKIFLTVFFFSMEHKTRIFFYTIFLSYNLNAPDRDRFPAYEHNEECYNSAILS